MWDRTILVSKALRLARWSCTRNHTVKFNASSKQILYRILIHTTYTACDHSGCRPVTHKCVYYFSSSTLPFQLPIVSDQPQIRTSETKRNPNVGLTLTLILTPYLPSTRLSAYGKSHPAFTPQPQSVTALWPVFISRPAEGRRLSLPGWLGEILRWFARRKTVTHPSTSRGGRESNSRPSSRKSNAITTGLPSPLYVLI